MPKSLQEAMNAAHDLHAPKDAKKPAELDSVHLPPAATAWAFSGGGFHAMSQAMAFTRAYEIAGMDAPDYIGSTSGGSWFTGQLLYSKSMNDAVRNLSLPIDEVVQTWFQSYKAAAYKTAPALKGSIRPAAKHYAGEISKVPSVQLLLNPLGAAIELCFAVSESESVSYNAFISWMMETYTPGVFGGNGRFSNSSRVASDLASTTWCVCATLPPTAWLGNSDSSLRQYMLTPTGLEQTDIKAFYNSVLPVAWVDAGRGGGYGGMFTGWTMDSRITGLQLQKINPPINTAAAPIFLDKRLDGGPSPFHFAPQQSAAEPSYSFSLPTDPQLAQTMAASSAALGFIGSPSMSKRRDTPLGFKKAPLGLQNMAPATDFSSQAAAPSSASPENAEAPAYRMLDGCYTDSIGIAHAISRMQTDADAKAGQGSSNNNNAAAAPFQLIALNSQNLGRYALYFKDAIYEAECATPGQLAASPFSPDFHAPSSQIFEEEFPDESQWTSYFKSDEWVDRKLSKALVLKMKGQAADGTVDGNLEKTSSSLYWIGTVTTIDNPVYNIKGGSKVRVLLFNPNLKFSKLPLLLVPSVENSQEFDEKVANYAQAAKLQTEAATPVIERFLDR